MNQDLEPRQSSPPAARNPEEQIGLFRQVAERAQLSWKLFLDRRVGFWPKVIPFLGLAYFLLPVDLLPEAALAVFAPLLTPLALLDDVGVVVLMLNWFIQASPPDIVQEYLREMRRGLRLYDSDDENVVDGTIEHLDE